MGPPPVPNPYLTTNLLENAELLDVNIESILLFPSS